MGRLRHHLRFLERKTRGETVTIPQLGGGVRRFPIEALQEAFVNGIDRVTADPQNRPHEHPLLEAARNSSDSEWRNSFYAIDEDLGDEPLEDLSEP